MVVELSDETGLLCDGDDPVGVEELSGVVWNAQERFESAQAARHRVDDGLVVRLDGAGRQGGTYVVLGLDPVEHVGVQGRFEHDVAVLAMGFGEVHGHVGVVAIARRRPGQAPRRSGSATHDRTR